MNKVLILAILQLPNYGRTKALSIINYIKRECITIKSSSELTEIINKCIKLNILKERKPISKEQVIRAEQIARKLISDSENQNIKITTILDDDFPVNLKNICDEKGKDVSPVVLWYKGNLCCVTEKPSIAIIGTRKPTDEGTIASSSLSVYFAQKGFNIISGLALGCDKKAHEGALSVTNGCTTAILAHGLDTIYPTEHAKLAEKILKNNGLLLSEYPIGTKCLPYNLVDRDRLQSCLSKACIIIQTSKDGGTMHAVKSALSNHKYLYAVKYKDIDVMNSSNVIGNKLLIENKLALPIISSSLPSICNFLQS